MELCAAVERYSRVLILVQYNVLDSADFYPILLLNYYNLAQPLGVGYAELMASTCGCSYYCAIMGITLFYLIQSFQSTLPWTVCLDDWRTQGLCGTENSTDNVPELYFK